MSVVQPSPKARPRLSLSEVALNPKVSNNDHDTFPVTHGMKGKKRAAMSMGGPSMDLGFSGARFGVVAQADGLSPKKQARRIAQPRKSILKPAIANTNTFMAASEEVTINLTINASNVPPTERDPTVTMSFPDTAGMSENTMMRLASSRRVSFAPNAHVRMFEKPALTNSVNSNATASPAPKTNVFAPTPTPPQPPAGSRPSNPTHSRRSSIQDIAAISMTPHMFVPSGEAEGEMSMDMETDEEQSDSDDDMIPPPPAQVFTGQADQAFSFGGSPLEEQADEEADMDITQAMHGGIIISHANAGDSSIVSDADSAADTSTNTDNEKTMDFTIAVGGELPIAPPAGAKKGRQSLGYSVPQPEGSSAAPFLPGTIGDSDEMEMEETTAFGGIINADDTVSSMSSEGSVQVNRERTMTFSFGDLRQAAQEEQADMDMTLAAGGIIAQSRVGFTSPAPVSITRPVGGTPSFARPTVSSATKANSSTNLSVSGKRNVFAPSPSPAKATPSKTGMQTAGEVAKRLSFGSITSSGGNKRARGEHDKENDAPGSSVKKARSLPSDSVFSATGRPSFPSLTAASPASKSTLTGTPSRSPGRSPAIRRALGVPVYDEVEEIRDENWQPQTISLSAFLEMAGVPFIDSLPVMNRRRSSVGKGVLGQSVHSQSGDREFGLHDYADAQLHRIFCHMYTWAANKMKADIDSGQSDLASTESLCSMNNPPVIQEYLSASDEDKQLFEMTFKAFKANTQLKAKGRWYDWKMGLMEKILPDVREIHDGMKEDEDRLDSMTEQTDALLPELRARAEMLQAELVKERAIAAEIEACDQADLKEHKEAVQEQSALIATFTNEWQEATTKLADLTAKLDDYKSKKAECENAIAAARSKCDQYTKSDVARLQDEYSSLQHLHRWRPTLLQQDQLELSYNDAIRLSFSCTDFVPDLSSAAVHLLQPGEDSGDKDESSRVLFEVLRHAVEGMKNGQSRKERKYSTLPLFAQRVGQLHTAIQRLDSEVRLVALRYPVNFTLETKLDNKESEPRASINVTLLLREIQSKVILSFKVGAQVLAGWPGSLNQVDVEVEVVYGSADPNLLSLAAKETISQFTPEGYVAGLLTTCLDVGAQYRSTGA